MGLAELEENNVGKMTEDNSTNGEKLKVLEIGCGWGSFLLYASAKFPSLDFVGFSNSATQIRYIRDEATRKGLGNLKVLKLDINDFCDPQKRCQISEFQHNSTFSRIISIECLEHRLMTIYSQFITTVNRL